MSAGVTIYAVLLRSVTGRGRLLALGALAATAIALAIALRLADTGARPDEQATQLINAFGLSVVVPIGALVVASAILGQLREDRTMVYLWLRPVGRGQIVALAWAAALTVTLALVGLPLVVAAIAAGGGAAVALGTAVAATLGLAAYGALFTVLGMRLRNALLWGLVYVLLWEGVLAALGQGVNNLALRNYTRSLLSNIADEPLRLADASSGTAAAVLVIVSAVALVLGRVLLRRMDVD